MNIKKDVNMNYTSDKWLQQIYDCTNEILSDGIAVPSKYHPCGWTWIDFSNIKDDEFCSNPKILSYRFGFYDFNNGLGDKNYEGLTLKEILIKTEGKFSFEINTDIDWDNK